MAVIEKATHNAQAQPVRHVWMGLKKKDPDNKTMKWLQIHDFAVNMEKDEVELLATDDYKKNYKNITDAGLEKKDVKRIIMEKFVVLLVVLDTLEKKL